MLFLAMDTNFKLKGKDRGINDPELAPGWVSFVEESRFQEHLKHQSKWKHYNVAQALLPHALRFSQV